MAAENQPLLSGDEEEGNPTLAQASQSVNTLEPDSPKTNSSNKWIVVFLIFFAIAAIALAIALTVVVVQSKSSDSEEEESSPISQDNLPLRQTQPWDISQSLSRSLSFETTETTWTNVDVSPDGTTLVFDVLGDLYTLPISGGNATILREGASYDTQPRFSPDGQQIIFRSDASGCDNIWMLNLNTKEASRVTAEPYRFVNNAQWMNASKIVATKWYTSSRSIPAGEIWTFDVSSTADSVGQQIVGRASFSAQIGPEEPYPDPSLTFVYYSINTADSPNLWEYSKDPHAGIYSIYRVALATGQTSFVTGGVGGAARPVVSHDGSTLAFVRRTLFTDSLILRNLASGEEAILYENLSTDQQESSAPHGVYPQFSFLPDDSAIVIWSQGLLLMINVSNGQSQTISFTIPVSLLLAPTVRSSFDPSTADSFNVKVLQTLTTSTTTSDFAYFTALAQSYVYQVSTGTSSRVTQTSTSFEIGAAVSSNGRQLAHATWNDVTMGSIEIITLDPTTGRQDPSKPSVIVTTDLGRYANPQFSPTGDQLVYARLGADSLSGPRAALGSGLYLVDLLLDSDGLVIEVQGGPLYIASGVSATFSQDDLALNINYGGRSSRVDLSSSLNVQTIASGPYTTSIVVSPNGLYAAFIEFNIVYVAVLTKTSDASITFTSISRLQTANFSIIRCSQDGGAFLTWSFDSSQLSWLVGPIWYSIDNVTNVLASCAGNESNAYGLSCVNAFVKARNLSFNTPTNKPNDTSVFAITNATVLTMVGDEVSSTITNGCVVVVADRIVNVSECSTAYIPSNAVLFNVNGSVVMPGFVDAHAHWSGTSQYYVQQSYEFVASLAFGITTLHNPSFDTINGFFDSELVRSGRKLGPRIFLTGTILYGADGTSRCEITSLDDARSNLRRLQAYGAWSAKSYNQPCRSSRQMLLQAARELGFSIVPEGGMALFWNLQQIIDGHTTIEHSIPVAPLYNDVLTVFAFSGTGYNPTMVVNFGGIGGERYWYQETNVWENERLNRFLPTRELEGASMRRVKSDDRDYLHFKTAASAGSLINLGVPVGIGAHGQRQGLAFHWEMWMLAQGGSSNYNVLRAATEGGARALGLQSLGVLQVGALADIIIFPPGLSPLENIYNTEFVQTVIVDGRVYDAATMSMVYPQSAVLPSGPILNMPRVGQSQTIKHEL